MLERDSKLRHFSPNWRNLEQLQEYFKIYTKGPNAFLEVSLCKNASYLACLRSRKLSKKNVPRSVISSYLKFQKKNYLTL